MTLSKKTRAPRPARRAADVAQKAAGKAKKKATAGDSISVWPIALAVVAGAFIGGAMVVALAKVIDDDTQFRPPLSQPAPDPDLS